MRRAVGAARAAIAIAAAVFVAAPAVVAQEQRLVEEVVARVNADVITRTQYLDVLQQTEADVKQNSPSPEVAAERFAEIRPKILDLMIDNLLIVQQGQELGVDVEARVNEQLVAIANRENKSITELEEDMRRNGVDPTDVRARLRERLVRDEVMRQEVYGSIWRSLTEKEKQEYYEANRDKFMQPGELKLSEIFLAVEGRSFTELEGRAREIVTAVRNGTAFVDLVKRYGDSTRPSYANNGSLGSFKSADELAAPLATAVGSLQKGQITEPIRMADGIILIYVDERRDPAPRPYKDVENDVAYSMVVSRSKDAEEKFLSKLRQGAYIRITDGYESAIAATKAAAAKE